MLRKLLRFKRELNALVKNFLICSPQATLMEGWLVERFERFLGRPVGALERASQLARRLTLCKLNLESVVVTASVDGITTRPSMHGTDAGLASSQHFEMMSSSLRYELFHPTPVHLPSTPRHGFGTAQPHAVAFNFSAILRRAIRLGG